MYQPRIFQEHRPAVLHALMRDHPLATLITAGSGGLMANLLPFDLIETAGGDHLLRAHLARANPQIDDLRDAAEALVVFQGPAAYVTPAWYASKAAHGKVVPTWNYATVQVRGRPRITDDPAWLSAQLTALTAAQETGRPQPWAMTDAPAGFIAAQMKGIVGLDIPIARIDGKWKVSQNRDRADRLGVIAGLGAEPGDDAAAMAALIEAPP